MKRNLISSKANLGIRVASRVVENGSSNVGKLFEKNMFDFYKKLIFLSKNIFFFLNKLMYSK